MDFFGIGGLELLLLLVLALIIFGPGKLGEAAKTMGKTLGEVRRHTQEAQRMLQEGLEEPTTPSSHPRPAPESSREPPLGQGH